MKWRWHTIAEWISGKEFTRGAEIGVKEGRFIRHMLETFPDLSMYAVDPWEDQEGHAEDYVGWDWGNIYSAYRDRVEPFGERALELHMYSDQASKLIKNGVLDFVFIDAQHDYLSVRYDIDLWQPKIRPGGLICGHDYCEKFPGVMLAVNDSFPDKQIITGANDVWGVWL